MDLLPDELLADILGRQPPRSLAASHCVRKGWCTIIDTRRLLRADLLPVRLDGFFCLTDPFCGPRHFLEHYETVFFSRPSTGRQIQGDLDLLQDDDHDTHNPWLLDHCNGLLLLFNMVVVNPATGQSMSLPPFPKTPYVGLGWYHKDSYLAYDPMVSPHYEVVLVPSTLSTKVKNKESEWPSSPFTIHVFSSRKWRWEERSFVREGEAAGTIADDMDFDHWTTHHAVYFRGAIYVAYPKNSVMRITLWKDRYQIIKSPNDVFKGGFAYLGKSQKGVYCALLSNGWSRFRVWLLHESCGEMEWVFKSDINLEAMVENSPIYDYTDAYSTPWIVNYEKDVREAVTEDDELEWDFESGTVLHETKSKVRTCYREIVFLGFHPYKEIAFFLVSFGRVVSYHLNSSKIQELGILSMSVLESFPYTPCWMELFENN